MFSPDELDAIHAQALRQWQQEQRRVRGLSADEQTLGYFFPEVDSFSFSIDDLRYLKALNISPA